MIASTLVGFTSIPKTDYMSQVFVWGDPMHILVGSSSVSVSVAYLVDAQVF